MRGRGTFLILNLRGLEEVKIGMKKIRKMHLMRSIAQYTKPIDQKKYFWIGISGEDTVYDEKPTEIQTSPDLYKGSELKIST